MNYVINFIDGTSVQVEAESLAVGPFLVTVISDQGHLHYPMARIASIYQPKPPGSVSIKPTHDAAGGLN
jgi:hypothetical protein